MSLVVKLGTWNLLAREGTHPPHKQYNTKENHKMKSELDWRLNNDNV